MEGVFKLLTGFTGTSPAVFHPRQTTFINSHGTFGHGHCAYHCAVGDDEPYKEDDGRKQPINRRRTIFSGDPAKNDDPNKNGNTDIAQPKMLALELCHLRLALVEPAGILNTRRTGGRVDLCVRLVLVHDGSFGHSLI